MSSLLTNSSAMVALQTLRSINTNLEQTNNRVSTGLRVNTAADNAAYWSIATTIKSDNGALGAVTDSLSLGASSLSTTYTGLDTAKTSLNDLKNQLVTATGENVDKAKIQQTIASIQAQLKSVADEASFSGQNWLSTGSDRHEFQQDHRVVGVARFQQPAFDRLHRRRHHQHPPLRQRHHASSASSTRRSTSTPTPRTAAPRRRSRRLRSISPTPTTTSRSPCRRTAARR